MRALEIVWKIFFCSFSSLFQILLCEASKQCFWDVRMVIPYVRTIFLVVRTIRLIRPDVHSSCPDERILRPLCGTTSERHLSFVRTVNPVGLNCILPGPARHFSPLLLCFFVVLCVFLVLFMRISLVHVSSLDFISSPGMYLYSFTNFF
jgi:hypothetical protein